MDVTKDRARLQTLTDAIVAATQALATIRQDEEIDAVHFGEFADGGWYWSLRLVSSRELGNTKTALVPQGKDYQTQNTHKVIQAALAAQMGQVDHLGEAMKNDSPRVVHMDTDMRGGNACIACGAPIAGFHRPTCSRMAGR